MLKGVYGLAAACGVESEENSLKRELVETALYDLDTLWEVHDNAMLAAQTRETAKEAVALQMLVGRVEKYALAFRIVLGEVTKNSGQPCKPVNDALKLSENVAVVSTIITGVVLMSLTGTYKGILHARRFEWKIVLLVARLSLFAVLTMIAATGVASITYAFRAHTLLQWWLVTDEAKLKFLQQTQLTFWAYTRITRTVNYAVLAAGLGAFLYLGIIEGVLVSGLLALVSMYAYAITHAILPQRSRAWDYVADPKPTSHKFFALKHSLNVAVPFARVLDIIKHLFLDDIIYLVCWTIKQWCAITLGATPPRIHTYFQDNHDPPASLDQCAVLILADDILAFLDKHNSSGSDANPRRGRSERPLGVGSSTYEPPRPHTPRRP